MKKLLVLFSLLFVATTILSQKTEGHISYEINVLTEDPEMEMVVGMLKGSTMDIYFKDELTRSVVDMGTMMKVTSISNSKSDQVLLLMKGMMGSKAIETTLTEMNKEDEPVAEEKTNIKFYKEKKKIAGYKCRKAISTDESGTETTFWYTNKIKAEVETNQFINNKIPGYPMEISVDTEKMTMVITVSKVEKKVSEAATIFDMSVPEGYETMSYSEFSKNAQ